MGPSFHQKKSLCWHLTMHLVSIQFGEIDYIASIEKPFSILRDRFETLAKNSSVVIDSNIYVCTWFYLFSVPQFYFVLDISKGQLISERLFDFFKFSKKNEKYDKFLPKNLSSDQIIKKENYNTLNSPYNHI